MDEKKELNSYLTREMFNTIRKAEIKNVKTKKNDDKKMAKSIMNYIVKQVEKEIQDEN